MIARILIIVGITIAVLFLLYWIFTGGLSRAIATAKSLDNPLDYYFEVGSSTEGEFIRLPGQPEVLLPGVDISEYTGTDSTQSTQSELDSLQQKYDKLYAQAKKAKNFGDPSPHRGKVTFISNNTSANIPSEEYVTLSADYQNSAPISLAGWTLQSAVTGARVPLPQGASLFVSGVVNSASAISLDPGASAIVVTGPSPVGTSFRENKCIGYLNEMQPFKPELDRSCPSGQDELPLDAENIRTYGDECIDYVKTLQQCHFPGLDPAPLASPACKQFLLNHFSYNGCVQAHKLDVGFYSKSWRLYLGVGANLWRDTHDVVRLLDDQGRTVDVLTY